MPRLIILIAVLLLGGCGWQPLERVAISPEFSDEEMREIEQACEDWFQAVPEYRVPVKVSSDCSGGCIRPSQGRECAQVNPMAAAFANLRPEGPPEIVICRRPPKAGLYVVALHELGHAIALRDDHLDDPDDVMHYSAHERKELTERDLEYVK